jgi:hypothetical protein
MKFFDEKKLAKIRVNSASKSRLGIYKKCPLMAAKKLRDTKKRESNSKALDIGILGHDLAEIELRRISGKEINVSSMEAELEKKYDLPVIYAVKNDLFKRLSFDKLFEDQTIIEIEESFSVDMEEVAEGFKLIIKPDAVSYREINGNPYMSIYEWKTGFNMVTEIDTESIIYAYGAYRKYGLPIIFNRVNLRNGKIFSHEFSPESLIDMEQMLISLMKRYKRDMEDEILPEFEPGSHCQYCDFINECEGRKYVSSLRHKYKAAVWAKELAKRYESEVKTAAKEVLSHSQPSEGEETVLLPFLNGKFGAVAEISKSFSLATRKVNKKDLIKLIKDSEHFEDFLDSMDIKIQEHLVNVVEEEFGIPVKEVIRTSIKLKAVEDN